jgi:hypothetical protein
MPRRAWALVRELDPIGVIAIFALVLGAVQLGAGALSTGVTIDEPFELNWMATWIEHGWYVSSEFLVDGRPDPDNQLANPYVYGPAFGALAHLANVVVGNEGIRDISHADAAYHVRHLVSAFFALLAAGAVGVAVSSLSRSRSLGLWAAAGLLAVPAWTGQGFFNPKDIPAGCGYTLVTVALVLALAETPGGAVGTRRRIAIAAVLAAGICFGVGTRFSLLAAVLLSLLAYAALRLAQRHLGGVRRGPGTDVAVAAGAGIGFAAIAALYPKVASVPLTVLTESLSGAKGFPWHGFTLTAGRLLSAHPPWYYLPAWIGASYPLLLGGLAILGALAWIRAVAMARREAWRRPDLGLLLVLQQALLLPVGATLVGATMYDGMRHHLYVLPAVAILAGVGAGRLRGWAASRTSARRRRGAVTALLALALLVPMAEETLLFPYDYTYVNPVAGIGGVNGRWETDYWFAGGPEAGSHIPSRAKLDCQLELYTWSCDKDQVALIEDSQGTDVEGRWRDDDSASWMILRRHNDNPPPVGCERAADVTRWLRGEQVVMSYVLRCP